MPARDQFLRRDRGFVDDVIGLAGGIRDAADARPRLADTRLTVSVRSRDVRDTLGRTRVGSYVIAARAIDSRCVRCVRPWHDRDVALAATSRSVRMMVSFR